MPSENLVKVEYVLLSFKLSFTHCFVFFSLFIVAVCSIFRMERYIWVIHFGTEHPLGGS